MNFWKKLLGVKQSSKADVAKREQIRPSAASIAQPPSIHQATMEGDLEEVKVLVKNNPSLVFTKDNDGYTPLHWAAANGHKDMAELLLVSRAEVNAKDNNESTPLHQAAANGHRNMVKLLLARNADAYAKDYDGRMPSDYAALLKRQDVVKLLAAETTSKSSSEPSGLSSSGNSAISRCRYFACPKCDVIIDKNSTLGGWLTQLPPFAAMAGRVTLIVGTRTCVCGNVMNVGDIYGGVHDLPKRDWDKVPHPVEVDEATAVRLMEEKVQKGKRQ